jgi:hypothetical protein
MGLLNRRERLIDTIITDEGRRQLISGRFIPAFYSFSDASAVYSSLDTLVSGTSPSTSISTLVSFEAFPLPQDQVAYEADDSGGLRVFGNNNYFDTSEGPIRVISGKLVQGWDSGKPQLLDSAANFASLATDILSSSADNFRSLMLLKSPDPLYPNNDTFQFDKTGSIAFHITDDMFLPGAVENGILESSENMFSDRRLSHIDNFSYLPPLNKRLSPGDASTTIGNYANSVNGNRQILTYDDLRREFQNTIIKSGSVQQRSLLQKETIKFAQTSITNRIVGQMFEVANGKITKLDVVDFGVFILKKTDPPLFPDAVPTALDSERVTATSRVHVYFVGKIFLDESGNQKFINMFSLIWN